MAKKLEVWGTTGNRSGVRNPNGGGQTQEIVAAKSRADAARRFGCTSTYLRSYGSITGNDHQIKLAMSRPGVVFYIPISEAWRSHLIEWTPVEPEA